MGRRLLPATCFLLLALAPSASAATVSQPIKASAMGGFSLGSATLTTDVGETDGVATVRAPKVALGRGAVFRLHTCVRVRVTGADSTCEQRIVDTRAYSASVTVEAPSVSASFARPKRGGGAGYASAIVTVAQRDADGRWVEKATSWPARGLAAAAAVIPEAGASTGVLPSGEGLPLPGSASRRGGVNTGLPDSFCVPNRIEMAADPGAGVTAGAFGDAAPVYHEVGEPTGTATAKGVMVVIHGGGWSAVGPGAVEGMRPEADRWRARGWRTVSITYRGCGDSLRDALWFYDEARARYGAHLPFCLTGDSAGGHLALSVATRRRDADCVIDRGGPTDALTLRSASTPAGGADGPRWAYNLLAAAFGEDDLAWYSPARFRADTRVLVGVAERDPYVPYAQALALRDRRKEAYVDTVELANGDEPFVHADVSQAALEDFHRREEALVAPLVGQE